MKIARFVKIRTSFDDSADSLGIHAKRKSTEEDHQKRYTVRGIVEFAEAEESFLVLQVKGKRYEVHSLAPRIDVNEEVILYTDYRSSILALQVVHGEKALFRYIFNSKVSDNYTKYCFKD